MVNKKLLLNETKNFDKDFIPFWELFGCSENTDFEEIDKKFKEINPEEITKEMKMGYKVLKDPFYNKLYKKHKSIEFIVNAGFFFDGYEALQDVGIQENKFLTTPLNKLDLKLLEESNDKPFIVLLCTGAFSPLHQGHINLMEYAKEKMELEGFKVIGGYLSPSHDYYVNSKDEGKASFLAAKRIHLMEMILHEHWLMIDKWESFYNKHSINFTNVILKLEKYLQEHINKNIKVCYVYGDDNEDFSYTFTLSDQPAVCVERINKNKNHNVDFYDKFTSKNKNIFLVENTHNDLSSTKIRVGDIQGISDNHIQRYYDLKETNLYKNDKVINYFIKNDVEYSFDTKGKSFFNSFIVTLQEMFQLNNIEIDTMSVKEQQSLLNAHLDTNIKTISLDPTTKADYNVSVSRLFGLGSSQITRSGMIGGESLKHIPKGDYILIEDDIDTGGTIKWFYDNKPTDVNIVKEIILNTITLKKDYYDVLDLRDFLIGSKKGGAVSKLGNETYRLPYILPFISPTSRAKIPFDKEKEFSLKVWELNKNFYESFNKNILLEELPEKKFINLMLKMGFNKKEKVIDICEFHINELKRT